MIEGGAACVCVHAGAGSYVYLLLLEICLSSTGGE